MQDHEDETLELREQGATLGCRNCQDRAEHPAVRELRLDTVNYLWELTEHHFEKLPLYPPTADFLLGLLTEHWKRVWECVYVCPNKCIFSSLVRYFVNFSRFLTNRSPLHQLQFQFTFFREGVTWKFSAESDLCFVFLDILLIFCVSSTSES